MMIEKGQHVRGMWDCAVVVDTEPTRSQVRWCVVRPNNLTWRENYSLSVLDTPVCGQEPTVDEIEQAHAKEIADAAYRRYLNDAEFHAHVYRAAQIAQVAMDPERAAFIETEFLLGAAVALHSTTLQSSDYKNAWHDLRDRLVRAAGSLQELANKVGVGTSAAAERARLTSKREGVNLALSYVDEWERTGFTLQPGEVHG